MRIRRFVLLGAMCLAVPTCLISSGCGKDLSPGQTLSYLQQGNATGTLEVVTDGRLGGEIYNGLRFGADGTKVMFKGAVDFSRPPGSGVSPGGMP